MRLLIIIFILFSCKSSKNILTCNEKNALDIANHEIKRVGFELKMLNKDIHESDENFYIHYSSKNNYELGNEAKIWISKKDCSIIDKKFYQ